MKSHFIDKLFSTFLFLIMTFTVAHLEGWDGSARADDYVLVPPAVVDQMVVNPDDNMPTPVVTAFSEDERICLAKTMYFEARGQVPRGIQAVGDVVMNRYADPRYPKNLCDIAYEHHHGVCQFSWHCDGKEFDPETITNPSRKQVWEDIKALASLIITQYNNKELDDQSYGAVNFHAYYVHPQWGHEFHRTCRIGAHIFFKRVDQRDI